MSSRYVADVFNRREWEALLRDAIDTALTERQRLALMAELLIA